MSQESETVTEMTKFILNLRQLARESGPLFKKYSDVGLQAAANTDKAAACDAAGVDFGDDDAAKASLLASAASLIDAIDDLSENRAVTQADWLSTMNKVDAGAGNIIVNQIEI